MCLIQSPIFFYLHLSILNRFVSSKIYDKCSDFDFDVVIFPLLDGEVPYWVYISQLIPFASVSSHVTDFSAHNKILTAKLLQQGYQYQKLPKAFSQFYSQYYEYLGCGQYKQPGEGYAPSG